MCIAEIMSSSAPFGLHSGYKNDTMRRWQSSGAEIAAHNVMLPLFITDESEEAKLVRSGVRGAAEIKCI